ncbi:hydrolase/aminopeptidase [Candidatus Protochlamydia phocaeensis]|uniref:hydrolase/aminopeptidase n=1 Tax=Candidatus Protochlamydia phocaeensis TaxID=1414722 RepID=UPI000838929F|nr:hydrolase/aminopeptidase [Candidatus Protochlamydia phocaeensis]
MYTRNIGLPNPSLIFPSPQDKSLAGTHHSLEETEKKDSAFNPSEQPPSSGPLPNMESLKISDSIRMAMDKLSPSNPTNLSSVQFKDPHTFSRPSEAIVRHMDLHFKIDFDRRQIKGKVFLEIENLVGTDTIHFDTEKLAILHVTDENGAPLRFTLGEAQDYLGQDLTVAISKNTKRICIEYETSPDARGLHWYTNDKDDLLLYSHSQPNYTRSWLPCQDTPQVRATYTAHFQIDPRYRVVMSANNNPQEKNAQGDYQLNMPFAIPSYLMAFCAGSLHYKPVGPRTGIYAHPAVIEEAYEEFNQLEETVEKIETILGPYLWERYDILFLPLTFPATATENPLLSFFSKMALTKDRSRFNIVYHELAHSYSGNLVTAGTWEDLWLNEGMTTWIELLLAETLVGQDYASMIAKTYLNQLTSSISKTPPKDTQLKMELAGRDPRASFTSIPYYKGYFFLKALETHFTRDELLKFLRKYFADFKFQSMTTEKFEGYLFLHLFHKDHALFDQLKVKEWLYHPGLPSNCPSIESKLIAETDDIFSQWNQSKDMDSLYEKTKAFIPQQWIYFIQKLRFASVEQLRQLDNKFNFKADPRWHIREQWLTNALICGYSDVYPEVKTFVLEIQKPYIVQSFLSELVKSEEGVRVAKEIFNEGLPVFRSRSLIAAQEIMKAFL